MKADRRSDRNLRWRKLDNTAKLFPVLANKHRTNVYRVAVVLKEDVDGEILKQALDEILPWFEAFHVRLRKGFFWYYFEDNKRPVTVEKEDTYPCRYINPQAGNRYLFRVTYYKKRINLEVFHAVTDGLGAFNFLKELTYCYLDRIHGRTRKQTGQGVPSEECLYQIEDSYVKNYSALAAKSYSTIKAFQVKADMLPMGAMNVIHGYVNREDFKKICIEKNASTTQILAALLLYTIYQEYWKSSRKKGTIALNLPVNLRNIFESETTMNFFAVTNIQFTPGGVEPEFDEILASVKKQMEEKITKERMEEIISYNVGYEKKLVRFVPLFIKELGTKAIYSRSEKSYTMTLSNLGKIEVLPEYAKEIESFHAIMGVGKSQTLKCTICTYGQDMVITFASVFEETYIPKGFFRAIRKMGARIQILSNGVNNETV
ncbi:MAG: hypothetical protein Q4B70_10235 [Lachnospiraceae bacterium]|nr:hypothetical protein [Lachnospiraceae bacterium]